jgi:hypothetical protein
MQPERRATRCGPFDTLKPRTSRATKTEDTAKRIEIIEEDEAEHAQKEVRYVKKLKLVFNVQYGHL